MTLIVSLQIPDGIVFAGDSLATIQTLETLQGQIDVTCPNCQHAHTVPAVLQGSMVPATSFPYAQKIFPFLRSFGVGTAGAGQLSGKTIYFIMRQLEREVWQRPEAEQPKTVKDVAEIVSERALSLLHAEAAAVNVDPAEINRGYVQFQVVGYDDEVPTTVRLFIGAEVEVVEDSAPGSYLIGVSDVASALWKVRQDRPLYENFSLQHAIEYAEFLITATASHQRFYGTLPNVGGAIDIALVTPFDGFSWIRQKSLFKHLSGDAAHDEAATP